MKGEIMQQLKQFGLVLKKIMLQGMSYNFSRKKKLKWLLWHSLSLGNFIPLKRINNLKLRFNHIPIHRKVSKKKKRPTTSKLMVAQSLHILTDMRSLWFSQIIIRHYINNSHSLRFWLVLEKSTKYACFAPILYLFIGISPYIGISP